jgi:hypothetical protein
MVTVQAPPYYTSTGTVVLLVVDVHEVEIAKSLVLLAMRLDSAAMRTVRNGPHSIYKYKASNASGFSAALDPMKRRASTAASLLTF